VHSTFVQPAITCPGVKNEWTSNWVGLDGFNDAPFTATWDRSGSTVPISLGAAG
jgi:hypothetical protein